MDDEVVVSVAGDGCTKRRLPLWMLGVAAADKVSKFEEEEEENRRLNNNVKVGIASQSLRPKSKSKAGNKRIKKDIPLSEQEPSEVSSCLFKKCKTKRPRRKFKQEEEAGSDSKANETVADTKRCNRGGIKFREYAPQKRRKAKNLRSESSSEEIETTASPNEDDGELTMDDLMSIAQEYVKTDEHLEQQQSSEIEQEAERRLPAFSLSGNESGGLPNAPQSNRSSRPLKEIMSVHHPTETLAGAGTVVNPSSRGDSAQDMLDLFLGPLLKKPPGQENRIELIKEDMAFTCEIQKKRQSNITTTDLVPLTKKKSSLKDKVAMFLD